MSNNQGNTGQREEDEIRQLIESTGRVSTAAAMTQFWDGVYARYGWSDPRDTNTALVAINGALVAADIEVDYLLVFLGLATAEARNRTAQVVIEAGEPFAEGLDQGGAYTMSTATGSSQDGPAENVDSIFRRREPQPGGQDGAGPGRRHVVGMQEQEEEEDDESMGRADQGGAD